MDKEYALSIPAAGDFNGYVNAALENNEITKDEWYEIINTYFTKLYLSKDNPRAQSGHGGDELHYAFSHLPILDAVYKHGTFLDVGCANGHLMEMVHKWGAALGFDLQVYGVDISEGLLELAKRRLPQWQDRFFLGNAFYWKPEKKFDYVHVGGLGGVPKDDQPMYFEHLMERYLAPGGRLILGPYWLSAHDDRAADNERLNVPPSGYVIKTHYSRPGMLRKALWFDKESR